MLLGEIEESDKVGSHWESRDGLLDEVRSVGRSQISWAHYNCAVKTLYYSSYISQHFLSGCAANLLNVAGLN